MASLRGAGDQEEPCILEGLRTANCLINFHGALKAISITAAGHDHTDVALCASRGIKVYACNMPGICEDTTADLGFALLLASARRIREGDRIAHDPSTTCLVTRCLAPL